MNPTENWRDYFDEKFGDEDPWSYRTSTYEQTKYTRQIRVAKDHLDSVDRILEIGCAEGEHSKLLLEAFPDAELQGISLSEAEVGRARDEVTHEEATFLAKDATDYLFELDDNFDLIVWSETIYYMGDVVSVPEMGELVQTVFDLLSRDGIIVSANIIGQEDSSESRITRPEVMAAYESLLDSFGCKIHHSKHTEWKEESGASHQYTIWAYEN